MNRCGNIHEPRLATTLHRTALELMRMRQLSLAIEDSLAKILANSDSVLSKQDSLVLQDLDLLSQSAEALANFLTKLSENVPENLAVNINEAFDLVNLEGVRNRLRGKNDLPMTIRNNSADVNIEVF